MWILVVTVLTVGHIKTYEFGPLTQTACEHKRDRINEFSQDNDISVRAVCRSQA
jgi:hypothetical protein